MRHNRIHQRALALILSFALVFGMVQMTGISAFAQDSGSVTAYYNGSGLFKDSACTQSVDHGDAYCSTITQIVVKEGTEAIGWYAFNSCSRMTRITIPNSVTSIDSYAFLSCSSLTEITLPDNLTSIGNCAFDGCSSLTGITLPDNITSIGWYEFNNCSSLTEIRIPDRVTLIDSDAFHGCATLRNVTFGTGSQLSSIGDEAFESCSKLSGITIPDSVTTIGRNAFDCCENLQNVTFGAGSQLSSIGNKAFFYCRKLTGITIPDRVMSIGDCLLEYCTAMQSIVVGPNNTHYSSDGEALFSRDKTELIAYPEGKTGNYQVPDSVTTIDQNAFSYSSLTSITFGTGSNLTSVGKNAFAGCESLTAITLPAGVTSIGEAAFSDCVSLKSMALPEDLTSVSDNLFSGCDSLTSVTIPKNVTSFDDDSAAFIQCDSLREINVEQGNAHYCSFDGVLYAIGTDEALTLLFCPPAKDGAYTVKAGTTAIAEHAFDGCSKLTDITLPEGLKTIDNYAFCSCTGLTRIDLPVSLTDAGSHLFEGCSHLKAVAVSANTRFGGDASYSMGTACNLYVIMGTGDTDISLPCSNKFYFTKSDDGSTYRFQSYKGTKVGIVIPTELYGKPISPAIQADNLPATSLTVYSDGDSLYSDTGHHDEIDESRHCEVTNVVIDDGATEIGECTFEGCSSLKELTIPARVTTIHTNTFEGCSSLQSITVASDNPNYCSTDGVLYMKENSGKLSLSCCPQARTGKLEIPANVDAIDYVALYECAGLTDVTIPSGVTKIHAGAFNGCTGLIDVTIPSGVTGIGSSAFAGCTALNTVVLEGASTTLGRNAFSPEQDNDLEATFAAQVAPGDDALNPEQGDRRLTVYVPQANLDYYNTAFDRDVLGNTVAEIKAIPVISAFDTTSQQITVSKGAAPADLNLPKILSATVNGVPHTEVNGVTWNADRPYDPNTTGTYSFTAVLPFYCRTAEHLPLPKLSVHVINTDKSILNFTIGSSKGTIDETAHTIAVTVPYGTNLTALAPEITVSSGATVSPTSGTPQDFTKPVVYTVTAQNGGKQAYTVAVASAPSESHSSGTPVPSHPSGAADAATKAQVDLSGAVMPAGVTSVTLSVTPEAANGTPTTPGATGGTPDPQAAAAFHLAVSDPALNIIGTPVLYNLKLLDQNGNPITGFSGKVTVKIPVPAGVRGTPHVFRYEESTGKFTDMNAVVENGFLVFSTEHFSYYTVAGVGDSVALDTRNYQMPVNGNYQIGLRLTGNKASSVKVYSTNGKAAAATRLKSGNVQVTAKGVGTAYIMIDVYDNKNHLLTHASVRIDVKTGIRPRGDSARQIGVF